MKNLIVILLLLIYGSATVGATVHLHYCMNEYVGWTLLHENDDKCGKCGMEENDKNSCCKDEPKHFKLKIDQQKADTAPFIDQAATRLPVPVIDFRFHSFIISRQRNSSCHAPPDARKEELNIFHCVFLI